MLIILVSLVACGDSSLDADTTQLTEQEKLCKVQSQQYIKDISQYLEKWEEARRKSSLTKARGPNIETLLEFQTIRYEVHQLNVPPCAKEMEAALSAYMNSTIDAYWLFINGASTSEVREAMDNASRWENTFESEKAAFQN
jgi:hypothetical protein